MTNSDAARRPPTVTGEDAEIAATDLDEIRFVLNELLLLRERVLQREAELSGAIGRVPEARRASARNLVHYLAVRREDLQPIQAILSRFGLSSLGRMESHVLGNIDTVIALLRRLAGSGEQPAPVAAAITAAQARAILEEGAERLFGPAEARRSVRIMVTLPTDAATDPLLIRELVSNGANCVRINCAHDDEAVWAGMIEKVRAAEVELGRTCRVMMDLSGPRVRTGEIGPGPEVLRVQPRRDDWGHVVQPARVWIAPDEQPAKPPSHADASLTLPSEFVARLRPGMCLVFEDTRGAERGMTVTEEVEGGRWAELSKTAYFGSGTRVSILADPSYASDKIATAAVGPIPPVEQSLLLLEGDVLVLSRSQDPGTVEQRDGEGGLIRPARIPCSPPEVLDWVEVGQRIWLDDGRIGGVITDIEADSMQVKITMSRPDGERLRSGKGINLPDSTLRFPPLTEADLRVLPFIVRNADVVGYSFVRVGSDVLELQRVLEEAGASHMGVVLKIEARSAYENLAEILMAALQLETAGVMIARGDLAVECGFARLAEVQEEILWLCEAAHLPVIWATQVLEQLSKQGRPTRAEVTDAAVAERAECVMLNKGRFVAGAVRALDSILARMQLHQEKKFPLLRPLDTALTFFPDGDTRIVQDAPATNRG